MGTTSKIVYRVPANKISFADSTRIITVAQQVIQPADILHIWIYRGSDTTKCYDAWLGVSNFAKCTVTNDGTNTTITIDPSLPVLLTNDVILIEYYADANLPVQYDMNSYSNVQGDFIANPSIGTKIISIANLGAFLLSSSNLIGADIRRCSSNGLTSTINTGAFSIYNSSSGYDITFPLLDSSFVVSDTAIFKISGPDKYSDNISNTELNTILNTVQTISPMPLIDTTNVAAGTNYYPSSDGLIVNQANNVATLWFTAGANNSNLIYLEVSDEDETVTSPANFKRYAIPTVIAEDLAVNTPSMPISGMRDLNEIFLRPSEALKIDIDLSQLISYRIRFAVATANSGTPTNKHYISLGGQMLGAGVICAEKKINNEIRWVQNTLVSTATAVTVGATNSDNVWKNIQQIDVRGIDQLDLFVTYAKNNSVTTLFQVIPCALRHSRTADDAELFLTDNLSDYQVTLDESSTNTFRTYPFKCPGYPYLQLRTQCASVGATPGTIVVKASRYGLQ
jgi:hypothetical protein